MDIEAYAAESLVETNHWWFVGRRSLFSQLIDGLRLDRNAAVLDVGTSTGTNLRMLRDLGFRNFVGLDQSSEAARFCQEKGLGEVHLGDVGALPFPDTGFDLVLATDIIEHVDDDLRALQELHRVLRPGGHVLLTVPAFEILWGLQDEVGQHRRRYRLPSLLDRLRAAQLTPMESFYFNYLLFFPILAARRAMRLAKFGVTNESQINAPWLNTVLTRLFRFDIWSARRIKPGVGVSALVLARRAAE